MVTESGIFEQSQTVAVNARFADVAAERVDFVFHGHQRGRDRLARAEVLKSASVGGQAPLVDLELLFFRLAKTIGCVIFGREMTSVTTIAKRKRTVVDFVLRYLQKSDAAEATPGRQRNSEYAALVS